MLTDRGKASCIRLRCEPAFATPLALSVSMQDRTSQHAVAYKWLIHGNPNSTEEDQRQLIELDQGGCLTEFEEGVNAFDDSSAWSHG